MLVLFCDYLVPVPRSSQNPIRPVLSIYPKMPRDAAFWCQSHLGFPAQRRGKENSSCTALNNFFVSSLHSFSAVGIVSELRLHCGVCRARAQCKRASSPRRSCKCIFWYCIPAVGSVSTSAAIAPPPLSSTLECPLYVYVASCTRLGKGVVPRLRESRLLTPSGRVARVHST